MSDDRAVWTTAYINNLPDSAFAVILPGGEKDDEGKTTPRSLRKLPHHNADGGVDMAHLRNAMSREPQTDMSAAEHDRARAHLERHAKAEGMGQNAHHGPGLERRTVLLDDLELRASSEGDTGPTISGYGAVFNSPSLDLGGFVERIAPGAFSRSLKSREDIFSFFNHDPSMPLGSRKAGNLTIAEDERGLHYSINPLPQTTYAADLAEAMRSKLVRGSSFSFMVRKDSWGEEKGVQTRTLLDVDLMELGPVTKPAYPKADSQVRSMLEARGIRLDAGEARDCDMDDDEMLEMLSGRAFDEMFLGCLIEEASDILELVALAPSRAGDPSIIELANRMSAEAQAEVQMLRDFQQRFMAGEPPPPSMEANSLPVRLALYKRRLQLARLAQQ